MNTLMRRAALAPAVDVFFLCRPQGSEVDDCPADVTLRKSGANQSLTRTVHALDGGTATVTVSDIDIDRVRPTITVEGRSCTAGCSTEVR